MLNREQDYQGGTSFMTHLKMIGIIGLLCVGTACSSTSMRVGIGDEESFVPEETEEAPLMAQDPIMPEYPPEPSRLAEPPILPEDPPIAVNAPLEPPVLMAEPEPPPVLEFEPIPEPEPYVMAEPEPLPVEDTPQAFLPEPEPVPAGPQFTELQDVLFDFDQARIRTDAVPFLESNAALLQTALGEKVVTVPCIEQFPLDIVMREGLSSITSCWVRAEHKQ